MVLFSPQSIASTDGKGLANVIEINGGNSTTINNGSLSFTITKNSNNNSSNSNRNKMMAINYTVNNGTDIVKSLSFSSNDADKLHRAA